MSLRYRYFEHDHRVHWYFDKVCCNFEMVNLTVVIMNILHWYFEKALLVPLVLGLSSSFCTMPFKCPSMPFQIDFLYDMILKGMPFQMPFQINENYLKGHIISYKKAI